MQGADIIGRISNKFPYVIVNELAEKLILYGRNVLGQSIVETTENLNENEVLLLLNINKEPIGIGRTKFSGKYLLQEDKRQLLPWRTQVIIYEANANESLEWC